MCLPPGRTEGSRERIEASHATATPNPALACGACDPLSRIRLPRSGSRLLAAAELWTNLAEYRRRMGELVSDEQRAEVRAIITEARAERDRTGRLSIGDAQRWDAERVRGRAALQDAIGKVVPGYRKLRKLQLSGVQTVAELARVPRPIFEPVVLPADPMPAVYSPPFALDRLGPLDQDVVYDMDLADRSFVRPEIGHLVLDADLAADPGSVWGLNEWFGIIPPNAGCVSAACGTSFTMPEEGRLQVTATLRNAYSRTTLSLTDEWGSSSGSLSVDATIFIAVLQPGGGEVLHNLVAARRLESDGDDKSALLPDIDQQPFNLLGNTEARFRSGESVFVLAGVFVAAGSVLNDMQIQVRTLMWWVLDELGIAVVQ